MRKKSWRCSAAVVLVLAAALGAQAAEKKKSKTAPQAILFGSVFQENGFLVRGARVVVWNVERPKERKETTSDVQGEFSLRVPAGKGKYTVEVSAPGFASEQKTVEIVGDERIDLTFRLARREK
ncbi:MAG: carboxypeptidase regulatory-like domain-containing protein [Acidobacteria bacterium]|nr:carboxypeptidase regulatory-like domain-containing protein [Acidobacteriota bacterium]